MRIFSIILFLIYFSTYSLFAQSWNLIWNDEFNSNQLDSTKWIHDIGTGSQYGLYGWGNGELQYYQPSNTEVYNGTAKIIAKEEPNGIVDSWGNTMYYSSSKITTKGIFEFRYGKVEARIKTVDGQGFWPAFWMLPSGGSWPCNGEIDIMEQWGSDGPTNTTTGAAHVGICPGSSFYQSFSNVISSGSYADNFHVYSIEWHPDYIAWYVDNVQFFQVTPSSYPSNYTWPFNSNDWYLMINLAISNSGWAPAPNSNTIFPSQIEIDYVRVYEQNGLLGCTDSTAYNYNPNATIDNGSCEYIVSFSVDLNCSTNLNPPSVVYVTSSAINWDCNTYALNDSNYDGIWTGNIILQNGFFEYIYCTDGWSNSESSGLITSMQNGGTCAPNTDYSTYANRLINISSDTIISNVWGSCGTCLSGCTDPTALNYDPNAGYDDGSCSYSSNFNVTFQLDMNNVTSSFTTPEVNGTFNGWCGSCWPMSDPDGDNVWDCTISIPIGSYEYKFAADNWNIQENLPVGSFCTSTYGPYTNRTLNLTSDTILPVVCWGLCSACNPSYTADLTLSVNTANIAVGPNGMYAGGGVLGDAMAVPLSDPDGDGIWDGTVTLNIGTSGNYIFLNSPSNGADWGTKEDLTGQSCADPNNWNDRIFPAILADTTLLSCFGSCDINSCTSTITPGCTDPLATNYDPLANFDDGSCTYVNCGVITGVNLTDVIHDRLVFNWDDMNSATCVVDQIRIRYREVGSSSYSNKTIGAPVGNNAPCLNTTKLVLNLTASTQYEYDFKIWYQDGTNVNWHANGTFTTADVCVNATNVTATPTSTSSTEFCWDAPTSPWSFVRLKYRIDAAGTSFSNIGGFGVMSPALCKTKNGLTPGTDYRVMWRTWCNVTGGPYRSPIWDGPVTWSQPTSIRVEGGTTINNLDVYPNPSRDIFNVNFTSEDVQNLELRIINVIGEVVYTENLDRFVGEYTKQVDLATYTKGIYFLEITTDNGVVNKKLVLY